MVSDADAGDHWYGGPWTEIKLDAVEYYLQCYTKALKAFGFDLTYIDAFAGTGSRDTISTKGGLFEGCPIQDVKETLAGSARRALAVQPPFDRFIFIEMDQNRCSVLLDLQEEFPRANIHVEQGDANEILRTLVKQRSWYSRGDAMSRGVVFLDPYALHVDWLTLRYLASSQRLDVWYLFPIRDTIRQLARNFSGIGPKEPMLDRVLGPEWRQLYALAPDHQPHDLFDVRPAPELERIVSVAQFEQWLKGRLRQEFKFVSEPLPILTAPNRQAFSLFLAVSNPSPKATELAEHFVRHVKRNFAPEASHRKSYRAASDR